jgi:hypothetical protein
MSLDFYRRNTFLGRTDQYLTSALSGYAVFDPLRDYFSVHHRDDTVTRLKRYHRHWRFYNGKHYELPNHGGDRKQVINYSRVIVNKSVDWLFGKGFIMKASEGNEQVTDLLQSIWELNDPKALGWRLGMIGGVTGDAYLFVTVPWFDAHGRPIPQEDQNIQVQALNSAYVHPKFSSSEDHTVIEALIQYPVDARKFATHLGTSTGSKDLAIYSQYISATEIREFVNEAELPNSPRPNLLGEVPLVHIQNLPHAGFFGLSDLDDIIPLNEELNETTESIRKIIKYHAEPTTVIFGAKASTLERGANKVWSNLPVDARIEHLSLDANLIETNQYREEIKLAIHELSCTPESSLGKIQPISNTSNAALETSYMPLIEKTNRKHITYGGGLIRASRLMLRYIGTHFGIDISGIVGDPRNLNRLEAVFPSPLPSDEEEVIRIEQQKLDANLQSHAGALARIEGRTSVRKSIEILADRREAMLRDREALASADGTIPNLAVLSAGSLGMTEGVAEAFEAQDIEMSKAVKEIAEIEGQNEQDELEAGEETSPEE